MDVSMRYEEVNGHRISGAVSLDIDNGEFVASVHNFGAPIHSSYHSLPYETRADADERMQREFDDEVEFSNAYPFIV